MKINNKSVVRSLITTYILLSIAAIFMLIGFTLISPEKFMWLKYMGVLAIIINIIKILSLKYIEYENSGEVITLRSYNIYKKKYAGRQIEMPLDKIRQLKIEKTFWINYLIINIQKNENREICIHFPVEHMKRSDLLLIQNTIGHQ